METPDASDQSRIREGTPESFGWLHRRELDADGYVVYERPDGQLFPFPKGRDRRVKQVRAYGHLFTYPYNENP